jgi:hypothetical protein
MDEFGELFVCSHSVQVDIDVFLSSLTNHQPAISILSLQFLNLLFGLTFGVVENLPLLAGMEVKEVVVVSIENLLRSTFEWVVVINIIHNFVIVLDDILPGLLISRNLIRHHGLTLHLGQLLHFILDVCPHLAAVGIE